MRSRSFAFVTMLFALGCGPGSPVIGTWRYALEATIPTATGPTKKMVTFDLDLAATASSDLVVWHVGGGCNVALPLVGKVAALSSAAPLCGLAAGAVIPLIPETGTVVKDADQLGVSAARFEVLDDGHLDTRFVYQLYTDLKNASIGPVISITTAAGTHGTHLK